MDQVVIELRNGDELDYIMDHGAGLGTLRRCLWGEKKHGGILITTEDQAQYVEKSFRGAVIRRLAPHDARELLYEQAKMDYMYGRETPDGPGPRGGATGTMWRSYLSALAKIDEGLARRIKAIWTQRSTEWSDKLQATQETDELLES